jgi:hypothetical protein
MPAIPARAQAWGRNVATVTLPIGGDSAPAHYVISADDGSGRRNVAGVRAGPFPLRASCIPFSQGQVN